MYLDSTIHKIYYTTTGNPNGMPVLLIHGGPGSGSSKKQADLLDKNKFYIVQIDQRGCGKSTPQGLLIENTTNNLILDIENVRKLLKIDKWVVVGGSWGGSLAIIYSYFFPERIQKLVIRNVFLCSNSEVDNLFSKINKNKILREIYSTDLDSRISAVKLWMKNESSLSHPTEMNPNHHIDSETIAKYQIQGHYILNNFFIKNNQLINFFKTLNSFSIELIHGELDNICPISNSQKLFSINKNSRLHTIKDCGHDPFHKEMVALINDLL